MRRYRQLWFVVAVTLGAVGLVGVLLGRPPSVIVAAVVAGGSLGWLGWRSFCRRYGRSVGPAAGAAAGVLGAVAALSLVGLGALFGANAVLIGLVVAATAPPVLAWAAAEIRLRLRWADRRADQLPPARPTPPLRPTSPAPPPASVAPAAEDQTRPVPSPIPPPPLPPATALHEVSDAELCWAWRTSFTTLQRQHSTADLGRRAQLVHLRQQYLDELERRNPAGFRRWLYSGARPASDPSRYIAPPPVGTAPGRATRVEPPRR